MSKKSELYKDKQLDIINKIINILDLKDNCFVMHHMDKDTDKQQEIMDLVPDIKKYFAINNISGIQNQFCERPWLSIAKSLLRKHNYTLLYIPCTTKVDNKTVRTSKYMITKKSDS
jgi:hypothetical protein